MAEMVTLQSPDGRLYRTDVPSEITALASRGYTRVDESDPDRPPEPVNYDQPDDEDDELGEWTDADDEDE